MNSMKVAMQQTGLIGGRTTPSEPAPVTNVPKNIKDGSAHQHPGSDAQVCSFLLQFVANII
jgi:hypothetical protein